MTDADGFVIELRVGRKLSSGDWHAVLLVNTLQVASSLPCSSKHGAYAAGRLLVDAYAEAMDGLGYDVTPIDKRTFA